MPSSLHRALVGSAALIALAGATVAGCAQEGTTPTCNNNVTDDGMLNSVDNPCHPFGVCFGTFRRTLAEQGPNGEELVLHEACTLTDNCGNEKHAAIECCCAGLSSVRPLTEGGDVIGYEVTNYSVQSGTCVNEATGEPATNNLTECLYGFGEVSLSTGDGGGGAGGGG